MIDAFAKDCDCPAHDGPYWIHMDDLDRTMNLDWWEKAGPQNYRGFAVQEVARLKEKEFQMKTHHVTEIPVEYCRPDLDEREHELIARFIKCAGPGVAA